MIYYNKLKNKRFRTVKEVIQYKLKDKLPEHLLSKLNISYNKDENCFIVQVKGSEHVPNNFLKVKLNNISNFSLMNALEEVLGSEDEKRLEHFEQTSREYESLTEKGNIFEDAFDFQDDLVDSDYVSIYLPGIYKYMKDKGLSEITEDFPLFLFLKESTYKYHFYDAEYEVVDIIRVINNNKGVAPVFNTKISVDDIIEPL